MSMKHRRRTQYGSKANTFKAATSTSACGTYCQRTQHLALLQAVDESGDALRDASVSEPGIERIEAELSSRFMAAYDLVSSAIEKSAVPGAALGLVHKSGWRIVRWSGRAQIDPVTRLIHRDTYFDLASLTKVIVTTTEILRLAERHLIRLDDPLTVALPELGGSNDASPERTVTFEACLSHQTHFPAYEPLYALGLEGDDLRAFILQRRWNAGPPVYSDINFILLGLAIERLTGRRLHDLPLFPGLTFYPDEGESAATENCPWRGRIICGTVHDENAHALGGAAGHAGLFGTIDGVLTFARALLAGELLTSESMMALRTRTGGDRTLGWQVGYPGQPFHDFENVVPVVGHMGFTGTGLWLNFGREFGWALLTNRVHPTRGRSSEIMDLRRSVGMLLHEDL